MNRIIFSEKALWKSSFLQTLSRIISLICNFIVIGLIARYLPADHFGAWSVILSIFQIILALDLGLGGALRNQVSKYIAVGAHSDVRRLTESLFVFLFIITILISIGTTFLDLSEIVGIGSNYESLIHISIIISALIIPFGMLGQMFFAYLEGAWIAVVEIIRSLTILLYSYISYNFNFEFSVFIFGYFVIYLMSYLSTAIFFIKKRKWKIPNLFFNNSFTSFKDDIKKLLMPAWLLSLMQIASMIGANIFTILVGKYLSLQQAGEYSAVFKIFSSIAGLQLAFLIPFWGAFALKNSLNEKLWIKYKINLIVKYTIALGIIIAIVMFQYGPIIILTWTSFFINDVAIYSACSIWLIFMMLANIYGIYLNSICRYHVQTIAHLLSAIFIITTTKFLTSMFDMGGILISMVGSVCIVLIFNYAAYRREISLVTNIVRETT